MFDRLVGNDHIKKILKRLKTSGRMPNSLLFAGEEGVGKKQFALETAKTFLCRNPADGEACDRCPSCQRAVKFNFPKSDKKEDFQTVIFSEHPDVGMIVPHNKNILVDAVRNLETEAFFRPFEGGARFFLIDEADKMTLAASNALLKTLEEPSPSSNIFLISARPDSLLQTIRSRCQTIRFAPVEAGEIEKFLLDTKKVAPDDAELIANLSAGSIGRALDFDLEKFRAQRAVVLNVLESLTFTRETAALLQAAEQINDGKNKEDFETYLEILQTLIHDIWILRLGAGDQNPVNVDLRAQLAKFAETAETGRLSEWLGGIEALRGNLIFNLNRKIATDAFFIQMAGV